MDNNSSEHVGYRLRDQTYITAFKRILAEVKPKMDPTVLAAAAGVIGAVIGAVLGGVFALKATKRQVEVMLLQSRGDVNERLYSQSLEIMRFFAENPEVRPYFYDNKDLSKAPSELEKLRVLSTAEMVAGFMELVALQIKPILSTRITLVLCCANISQLVRPGMLTTFFIFFPWSRRRFQHPGSPTNRMRENRSPEPALKALA